MNDNEKDALTAENARLKEALEFCSEILKAYHPIMNPEEPCIFYDMRTKIEAALKGKEWR